MQINCSKFHTRDSTSYPIGILSLAGDRYHRPSVTSTCPQNVLTLAVFDFRVWLATGKVARLGPWVGDGARSAISAHSGVPARISRARPSWEKLLTTRFWGWSPRLTFALAVLFPKHSTFFYGSERRVHHADVVLGALLGQHADEQLPVFCRGKDNRAQSHQITLPPGRKSQTPPLNIFCRDVSPL